MTKEEFIQNIESIKYDYKGTRMWFKVLKNSDNSYVIRDRFGIRYIGSVDLNKANEYSCIISDNEELDEVLSLIKEFAETPLEDR